MLECHGVAKGEAGCWQAGRLPHNVLRQVMRLAVGNAQVNIPAPRKSASAKRADFRGWVGGGRGRATQSEWFLTPPRTARQRALWRAASLRLRIDASLLVASRCHEDARPQSLIAVGGHGARFSRRGGRGSARDRRRWPCRWPCSDPARAGGPERAGGRPPPRVWAKS
jgi:hypothetical protein